MDCDGVWGDLQKATTARVTSHPRTAMPEIEAWTRSGREPVIDNPKCRERWRGLEQAWMDGEGSPSMRRGQGSVVLIKATKNRGLPSEECAAKACGG